MSKFKKKRQQNIVDRAAYPQSSTPELPGNYSLHDGFLFKGDTPVSLATSGIVENTARGFLHVEKTEKYKTK